MHDICNTTQAHYLTLTYCPKGMSSLVTVLKIIGEEAAEQITVYTHVYVKFSFNIFAYNF